MHLNGIFICNISQRRNPPPLPHPEASRAPMTGGRVLLAKAGWATRRFLVLVFVGCLTMVWFGLVGWLVVFLLFSLVWFGWLAGWLFVFLWLFDFVEEKPEVLKKSYLEESGWSVRVTWSQGFVVLCCPRSSSCIGFKRGRNHGKFSPPKTTETKTYPKQSNEKSEHFPFSQAKHIKVPRFPTAQQLLKWAMGQNLCRPTGTAGSWVFIFKLSQKVPHTCSPPKYIDKYF